MSAAVVRSSAGRTHWGRSTAVEDVGSSGGVPFADRGYGVRLVPVDLTDGPRGWLLPARQHPCRLAGGAVSDVLAQRWDEYRATEDSRRDLAHRLRPGAAADQDDPLDRRTVRDHRVQPVGECAQHPLNG